MNKKLFRALIMALTLLSFSTVSYALFASGKITIKVVSEAGNPIDGARVGIGFDDVRSKSKENSVIGFTDDEGSFSGSETTTSGYLAFNVTKDGYYKTTGDYQFKGKNAFGWEPWNPELTVVLRKIENPVPMYARQAKIELPVSGKDVGFDLVEYDWVIPFGKGKHSDLIFNLKSNVVDKNEFDSMLTIKFSDQYDGIQQYKEDLQYGSRLKLPKIAPDVNFKDTLTLHEWRSRGDYTIHKNFDFYARDLNYIFRVRSIKEDKEGKKIRSIYGKIIGSIKFDAVFSKTGTIRFLYYLNPDYTRNLEFDPKRNLFGNLPDMERVTEP